MANLALNLMIAVVWTTNALAIMDLATCVLFVLGVEDLHFKEHSTRVVSATRITPSSSSLRGWDRSTGPLPLYGLHFSLIKSLACLRNSHAARLEDKSYLLFSC
jgi:hypothetical protein